jgi:hypothetical protein
VRAISGVSPSPFDPSMREARRWRVFAGGPQARAGSICVDARHAVVPVVAHAHHAGNGAGSLDLSPM